MRNSRIPNKICSAFALICYSLSISLFAYADCTNCASTKDTLNNKTARKALVLDAQNKNNEYIKNHPDASRSILIKLRSNLIVIALQAETLENEITVLNSQLTKEGCASCK